VLDATPAHSAPPARCRSVRELARYWRCAPGRVRVLVRRDVLQGFLIGRALRFTPEAVAEAERLLAAPVVSGRRRRVHDGIAPEVVALLNGG